MEQSKASCGRQKVEVRQTRVKTQGCLWMRIWALGFWLGCLVLPLAQTEPVLLYSHGDPSAEEQYSLELMNRARANPAAEGVRLAGATDPYITQAMSQYGINKASLIKAFTNYPPRPPAAFNPKLLQSSRGHSADMAAHGFQGHVSSDGRTFPMRIQAVGYSNAITLNEALYAYAQSPYQGHASFLIDWGVPSLGHRIAMLNYIGAVYSEVGIGLVRASSRVGPWVLTHDYAQGRQRFLLGVVYSDKDRNGFYSVGEGIQGVTVSPDAGSYYAITSASGGYAVPLSTNHVRIVVTFSSGPLKSSVASVVAWQGENLKLDLETAGAVVQSSAPPYLSVGPWTDAPDGSPFATMSVPSKNRAVLQSSPDLGHWINVATNMPTNGVVTFRRQRETNNPPQFYRAAVNP
jgi:hypothetical protein